MWFKIICKDIICHYIVADLTILYISPKGCCFFLSTQKGKRFIIICVHLRESAAVLKNER